MTGTECTAAAILCGAFLVAPCRAGPLDDAPERAGCRVAIEQGTKHWTFALRWKEPRAGQLFASVTAGAGTSGAGTESPWQQVGVGWVVINTEPESYAKVNFSPAGLTLTATVGGKYGSCDFRLPR